ncbi:MAG: DMT family transporter [Sphingomonadaceae bacterium]
MQDHLAEKNVSTAKAPLRFGLSALVLGNLALSIGPWLVREADTGPVASAFWRLILAVPLLFLFARRFGGRVTLPAPALLGLMAAGGLFFAADLAAWHIGIFYTKLANSNLLGNSTSFLLPLWAFITARQWPSTKQGGALGLAALGAIFLMGRSFELSPDNLYGDLLCLLAGALYTAYLIVMARARGEAGPWPTLAWVTLLAAPPLLVAALAMGETIIPQTWTPLLLLALFSQIIGQGLMIYAIGRVSAVIFGLLLLLQPALAALIGWFVYNERLGTVDLVGAILIGLALVLVSQPEKA